MTATTAPPSTAELARRAREMRKKGTTVREIARELEVSPSTAHRLSNPDAAKRENEARREARSHGRPKEARRKAPCPKCGREMWVTSAQCQWCYHGHGERDEKIVELWESNATVKAIAAETGLTVGGAQKAISRLRREGRIQVRGPLAGRTLARSS